MRSVRVVLILTLCACGVKGFLAPQAVHVGGLATRRGLPLIGSRPAASPLSCSMQLQDLAHSGILTAEYPAAIVGGVTAYMVVTRNAY